MAKSYLNKKQIRRIHEKAQQASALEAATKVRLFAESLTNQQQLDTWLLQQADTDKRLQMYDFIRPFLRFESVFPSKFNRSLIIAPGVQYN